MKDNESQQNIFDVESIKQESTGANRGMYKDYGSYYEKPQDRTGEGYGIASLVLGIIGLLGVFVPILGLIPCILAIILGTIGMKAINRGLAIAGLSLGIVALLPQLFLVVLLLDVGF